MIRLEQYLQEGKEILTQEIQELLIREVVLNTVRFATDILYLFENKSKWEQLKKEGEEIVIYINKNGCHWAIEKQEKEKLEKTIKYRKKISIQNTGEKIVIAEFEGYY